MAWRFGDFTLDEERRQLVRAGMPLALEPKAYELLSLLVARRPRALSKDQIHEVVWAGTFVSESALAGLIADLRSVLGDDARRPRFIRTVHGFGYAFCGEAREDERRETAAAGPSTSPALPGVPPVAVPDDRAAPEQTPTPRRLRADRGIGGDVRRGSRRGAFASWLWATAGAASLGLAAIGVWYVRLAPASTVLAPMTVVALTTLTGDEFWPTFSPDGEQVAFAWNGENEDNFDIYVKLVGAAAIRRLTSDPVFDGQPNWSPDAKHIAFLRCSGAVRGFNGSGCRIYLTSPISGPELKLSDLPINEANPRRYSKISWSPDGKYLAASLAQSAHPAGKMAAGIYLVPVAGGPPRPLTQVDGPAEHLSPAIASDGRHLAYTSCAGGEACDVYVLNLDAGLMPSGAPRRLTDQKVGIGKVAWNRDGRFIVYDTEGLSAVNHLWRVALDGRSLPERIESAGFARQPATTMARDRLAFTQWRFDFDIYRFQAGAPPQPFLTSSFLDTDPQFSPDGRRLAFSSGRAAETPEIWIASADGQGAYQLTHGPGKRQLFPHWSPDGRQIVFASTGDDGHHHLWTIDVTGGAPHQLTSYPGDQHTPAWSRDGQWIYFSADSGRGRDVWRIPAAGGTTTRITQGGSDGDVWESADGTHLFYTHHDALMTVPAVGGSERQVMECVKGGAITVGPSGIYYAACSPTFELESALHVMDPDTHRDRLLGTLKDYWVQLAVSPDEKTILYRKVAHRGLHGKYSVGTDLMLIENFR
jgi:Tol biopolymer transport system component/DNA-binding winged helix-turn-helix (wHTH) protein